jgi:hypothetical protein
MAMLTTDLVINLCVYNRRLIMTRFLSIRAMKAGPYIGLAILEAVEGRALYATIYVILALLK